MPMQGKSKDEEVVSTPRRGDARISEWATPKQVREVASPAHRWREEPKTTPKVELAIHATPSPSHHTRGNFPVYLHVYDLGPISRFLVNSWALNTRDSSCLGVFHCGVEVLGVEFSFQAMADCGEDDETSGLTWHNPKSHPRHVFRESICLGNCELTVSEVGKLLEKLEKAWPARTYHCLSNNCVDFAEHFVRHLKCPDPFPRWVHGLAKNLAQNDQAVSAGRFFPCSAGSCGSTSMSSISLGRKRDPQSENSEKFSNTEVVIVEEKLRSQGCSLFCARTW